MWDSAKALAKLESQTLPGSHGLCAQYTRQAIEAGGVVLVRHTDAKDYGSSLIAVGFVKLNSGNTLSQAGDVGIVQPIPGHPEGHMAMFDGKHWISDFLQLYGLYPNAQYRTLKPATAIYRYQTHGIATPVDVSHLA